MSAPIFFTFPLLIYAVRDIHYFPRITCPSSLLLHTAEHLYFRVEHLYFQVEHLCFRWSTFTSSGASLLPSGAPLLPGGARWMTGCFALQPPGQGSVICSLPIRLSAVNLHSSSLFQNPELYEPIALSWLTFRMFQQDSRPQRNLVFHPPQQ